MDFGTEERRPSSGADSSGVTFGCGVGTLHGSDRGPYCNESASGISSQCPFRQWMLCEHRCRGEQTNLGLARAPNMLGRAKLSCAGLDVFLSRQCVQKLRPHFVAIGRFQGGLARETRASLSKSSGIGKLIIPTHGTADKAYC